MRVAAAAVRSSRRQQLPLRRRRRGGAVTAVPVAAAPTSWPTRQLHQHSRRAPPGGPLLAAAAGNDSPGWGKLAAMGAGMADCETEPERRRLAETARWLDAIVIGQRLCPFATAALPRLRLRASRAAAAEGAVAELLAEAAELDRRSLAGGGGGWGESETTLLVLDGAQPWAASWRELLRLSWEMQAALADVRPRRHPCRCLSPQLGSCSATPSAPSLPSMGRALFTPQGPTGIAERLQMVLFHPAAVHSLYADPSNPDPADFAIRGPFPTIAATTTATTTTAQQSLP